MEIFLISLLTIVAVSIGTITGFGTSTVMVPVLLLFYPLPQTLILVGIIHWFGDVWKILLFRKGINWKLIVLFGVTGSIATFIGSRFVFSLNETLLSRILGAFLIIYVFYLFTNPKFKIGQSNKNALTGGALYGFFAGIFGIGGAVRSAFLSIFDLPKAVYITTSGAIGLIVDSVRITSYFRQGTQLTQKLYLILLILVPLSFIGARLAKKTVNYIPQSTFRKLITIFLFVIGLKFIIFP